LWALAQGTATNLDSRPTRRFTSFRDDAAVGWEELGRWGDDVARIEPLTAGGVNEVWSVRVNGQLAVGRLGRRSDRRSDADLAWEMELLRHLDREGMTVPVPIPTTDGRDFVNGLVVMRYVEGRPPETEADWRRVADTFRQLHRLTYGWPQRPGWRSSIDFVHAQTGTRIDLGAMPPQGAARCRAIWAQLGGRERCVVHGDPTPGNIRMTADRVALIDWDESRVDVSDFDLVLPHNAAGLDEDAHDLAAQAWAAWDAALCYTSGHHEFAAERLAEVRAL
jgi:Ser/Thr protein kinase RdoA (MazF antagonist)